MKRPDVHATPAMRPDRSSSPLSSRPFSRHPSRRRGRARLRRRDAQREGPFAGAVPTKKIIPTKDKEVCGDIREEPEIVVGADKGVTDAVVYLKAVEKGKAWQKPAQKPEIVDKNCRFVPNVQALPVGTIVIRQLRPGHAQHPRLPPEGHRLQRGAAGEGTQRIERPLKKPGVTRVECDAHGWMLAWIYVADNPYYAVTKKDGTFSIPEPLTSYTLVAWHAFTGETELPVTVKAKETVQANVELKKKVPQSGTGASKESAMDDNQKERRRAA